MDITLGVLADYASVSQDGKLNIMGIFGEINPPMLPFGIPMMYLILSFEASPSEYDTDKAIKVTLLDSEGKAIMGMEQSMRVQPARRPGSRSVLNAVVGLAGIKFEHAGDYAFSVLVGGEEKKSIMLHVNEPVRRIP
jgi:hypothetical protein